jgi:septum formation protein
MHNIVLASASTYKQALFSRLQLPYAIDEPNIDEKLPSSMTAKQGAEWLALEKAKFIANRHLGSVVIGADQIAELAGEKINKPMNHKNAVIQLNKQSGKRLKFHTGLAIIDKRGNQFSTVNTTEVVFRQLSEQKIEDYLYAEEPYNCAGSFKSEGLGITLFERIESDDPTSLVGLPLIALSTQLIQMGLL